MHSVTFCFAWTGFSFCVVVLVYGHYSVVFPDPVSFTCSTMPRCRKSSAFNVAVDLCTYNDHAEKEDQLSGRLHAFPFSFNSNSCEDQRMTTISSWLWRMTMAYSTVLYYDYDIICMYIEWIYTSMSTVIHVTRASVHASPPRLLYYAYAAYMHQML